MKNCEGSKTLLCKPTSSPVGRPWTRAEDTSFLGQRQRTSMLTARAASVHKLLSPLIPQASAEGPDRHVVCNEWRYRTGARRAWESHHWYREAEACSLSGGDIASSLRVTHCKHSSEKWPNKEWPRPCILGIPIRIRRGTQGQVRLASSNRAVMC